MICIGVYETDAQRRKEIRNTITKYSAANELLYNILWFTEEESTKNIDKKYLKMMQLAFISLDSAGGEKMGEIVYQANSECRICFYKSARCDLEQLLSARPLSFYHWEKPAQKDQAAQNIDGVNKPRIQYEYHETLILKLKQMIQDLYHSRALFTYDTRKAQYCIPVENLLYFRSNLKYVEVYDQNGLNCTIYAKLTDIEANLHKNQLMDRFLRVHKSYLVNIGHIRLIDKADHFISLSDGTCVPISDAQYNYVIKRAAALPDG